jgi:hypothetical protein
MRKFVTTRETFFSSTTRPTLFTPLEKVAGHVIIHNLYKLRGVCERERERERERE